MKAHFTGEQIIAMIKGQETGEKTGDVCRRHGISSATLYKYKSKYAVAESFFHLLKRERIRRRTYLKRDAARQDVFDYIEMFYNPTRKHTNNGMMSPVDYEMKQKKMNEEGL